MIFRSRRTTGVLLVLVSAVAFSSAGLFIKGAETNVWNILFWRGVSATLFTTIFLAFKGTIRRQYMEIGKPGILAGIIGGASSAVFVSAFMHTTIANVSLIYAASPFVAALIMWIWIRERPTNKVLVASCVAIIGMLVIVSDSLGELHIKGDLLALLMTFGMSLYLCFYRRYPGLPTAGPAVLSQVILLPLCLVIAEPFAISTHTLLLIICFGAVFVFAAITLAEGASRLPASETSLLSTAETPLAPIWAFLIFTEVPTIAAFIGGVVISVSALFSQLSA